MHRRKMKVGSFIGILVLGLMVLALLIYTATRTLHFLEMMFPPDMQYVAYLALVAFDGGILGWTLFATTAAEGAPQRAISYAMIFVSVVGVAIATIADTALVSQANGITKAPPQIATVGMWGTIIVIVLNVVAGICAHLFSPSHMRKFELESVHDEIHQLTIDHIKSRARDIMPQLAAENAEHWVRQTMAEVIGTLPHKSNQQLPPPARVVESDPPKSLPTISHKPIAQAASPEAIVDPHGVKSQVDAEKKDVNGEKKGGFRAWVDKNIFKDDEPITEEKNGEVRTRRVGGDPQMEAKEEEEIAIQRRAVRQMEEENRPGLPIDPRKWARKHWMIAKELMNEDEYNELFNEYLGDQPSEEEVRDEKQTRRLDQDPS